MGVGLGSGVLAGPAVSRQLVTRPAASEEAVSLDWSRLGDSFASQISQHAEDTAAGSAQNYLDGIRQVVLRHSADRHFRVSTYRQFSGIPDGNYELRALVKSTGEIPNCFMFARANGYTSGRTHIPLADNYLEIVLPGLVVNDGKLIVGVHTQASADSMVEVRQLCLRPAPRNAPLRIGGDISALTLMERHGARYADAGGKQGDALEILKGADFSFARIRLYVNPGKGRGNDGYYWPADSMNTEDGLRLAKRATQAGMQIQLTLHFSDFWTNSTTQKIPHDWQQKINAASDSDGQFEILLNCVASYTREVMQKFSQQNTAPAFVSLGNEVELGMLYPFGRADAQNWPKLARLYRCAYHEVKQVFPQTQVVIHLDDAGNAEKYHQYFDAARSHKVCWDVIGCSYYPFWSSKKIEQIAEFIEQISQRYGCDLMLMEAGFNWAPRLPEGYAGQLSHNGPYPASMSSPQGQKQFMNDLLVGLKRVPSHRIAGVLYWDPIFIAQTGIGWAYRETDDQAAQNVVSNTCLFDFDGRALPVLDAYRDNAAPLPL